MFEMHEKRKWDWNVIRPNGIIGFTPSSKLPCYVTAIMRMFVSNLGYRDREWNV